MFNQSDDSQSLCICLTPLHVLIAEKIAQKLGSKFDKALFLSYQNDSKSKYYFEKMAGFCHEIEFIQLPQDDVKSSFKHLRIIAQRWSFRLKTFRYLKYKNIYLPTSYNTYLMILLATFSAKKLNTFDDGILNIAYEEIIPPFRIKKLSKKLFTNISGVFFSIDDLVRKSSQHFSIYPESENVCKNPVFLKLSTDSVTSFKETTSVIKLIIGPSPEADSALWSQLNKKIAEILPDEFLPHPRDISHMAKNVPYVDTQLIAEDYVLQLILKHPSAYIEVYGLQSSALIHLASLPNVSVFSFMDNSPQNKFLNKIMSSYGVAFL